MTQYVCNPITVDAFQIVNVDVYPEDGDEQVTTLILDNGKTYTVTSEQMARMTPKAGDYLVRTSQPDQYEYLNPQHVFEAKYTKVSTSTN